MNLLIDIGNQNIKWSCGEKNDSFSAEPQVFETNVKRHWSELDDVTAAFMVNVSGTEIVNKVSTFILERFNVRLTEIITSAECCGVKNSYHNVSELGADRWVALIGARALYSQSMIVVDCGTAITVDALAEDGAFVGGSILPGFRLSQTILWSKASKIDEFEALQPTIPARSTVQAVSSGISFGIVGGIERLIDEYRQNIGFSSKLMITGGDAALVLENTKYDFEHVPQLVLQGLATIAESKAAKQPNDF